MSHEPQSIGQSSDDLSTSSKQRSAKNDDFVLEKSIFNNVFEKDIRRVFMYKKAERLAKAIHLIAPAFVGTPSLQEKIHTIAVGLVDGAILAPSAARAALSRELLTLSSVLAIARTGGLLSEMNADLISREAHFLLQEVASYEEPRLMFDPVPSIADMTRSATAKPQVPMAPPTRKPDVPTAKRSADKGHVKDRRASILEVIGSKGQVSIKDISHLMRGVSEKTIQRELAALVQEKVLIKQGERRWSTYALA